MNFQESNMYDNYDSRKVLIIFIIFMGLTLIIFGASLAFFSYEERSESTNYVKSGTVTLHYNEKELTRLNLESVLPMNETNGKKQDYFEFDITADTINFDVPYIVTARLQGDAVSRIPEDYVTVYLTEVNGTEETQVLLTTYDELQDVSKNNHTEQELFRKTVVSNTSDYSKTYRLRLWVNETANYAPYTDENQNRVYPMEDKSFSITLNVYTEVNAVAVTCDTHFDLVGTGKQALEVGDEVKIDNEHFVVAGVNGNKTTLIAKYNLALLSYATIPGSVEGYQLKEEAPIESQTVPFSHTNYWAGSSDLSNIYDSTKNVAPTFFSTDCNAPTYFDYSADNCYLRFDNNSSNDYSIAYYVEDYKNKIEAKGATINTARLLTIDEVDTLKNNTTFGEKLSGNSFWLGSADDSNNLYRTFRSWNNKLETYTRSYNYDGLVHGDKCYFINDEPICPDDSETSDWDAGVRPVLEVPTCSIDLTGE